MKILVVDDEEDVQKLILRHFRQEIRNKEFEFCFAYDGTEALAVLKAQPDISIIITDINMPKMDGLTLLTQINELRSERQAIVVSAYDDLKNIRTAMNNGAFDFVVKPIDLQDFTITLRKTISYIKAISEVQTRNTELTLANDVLRQANELKSQLLGIAAHDLRNPLQIVLGFSSLIIEATRNCSIKTLDDVEPAMQNFRQMGETIQGAAERMIHLIKELLDNAELESGKLALKKTHRNISEIAAAVVQQSQLQASRKNQRIFLSAEEHCIAHVDWSKMLEVIDNLLSNAIKYSPNDKNIWVDVRRIAEDELPPRIQLSIRDEGQGLTDEDKEKLFGAFQRLSARPTGDESSIGLGLHIVKQLVELHGGTIRAESLGRNHGSTFIVELPASM